ncbi:unnamed protein product, partial [Ixodes pacificus]
VPAGRGGRRAWFGRRLRGAGHLDGPLRLHPLPARILGRPGQRLEVPLPRLQQRRRSVPDPVLHHDDPRRTSSHVHGTVVWAIL